MPLDVNKKQCDDLQILQKCSIDEAIALCKSAFDYLLHGPNEERYANLAKKHQCKVTDVRDAVEALISIQVDATKANVGEEVTQQLQNQIGINNELAEILAQFVTSKRNFVESSIKSANIRAYRLVNLEWRLEVRIASRSLLRQNNIFITMKLYLHTEPKNENRDLINSADCESIHPDERQNRKDVLVQTDVISLRYMIQSLEDALMESKSRRIRNIVKAIH